MPSGCNAVRVYAIKTSESRLLGLRGRKREKEKERRGEEERAWEREVKSEREAEERERESERGRVKGNRWPRER